MDSERRQAPRRTIDAYHTGARYVTTLWQWVYFIVIVLIAGITAANTLLSYTLLSNTLIDVKASTLAVQKVSEKVTEIGAEFDARTTRFDYIEQQIAEVRSVLERATNGQH